MTEFNLEARWVEFSERSPAEGDIVLARRKTWMVGSIYLAGNEDYEYPLWVFNGEFYMHAEDLEGWEWLEIKEKGGE